MVSLEEFPFPFRKGIGTKSFLAVGDPQTISMWKSPEGSGRLSLRPHSGPVDIQLFESLVEVCPSEWYMSEFGESRTVLLNVIPLVLPTGAVVRDRSRTHRSPVQ